MKRGIKLAEIWAIAFQVSGAIILLLWSIQGAKKEKIIERYFPGSSCVERDDEDNCILKKERLQKISKEAYLNILAFVDIAIGYSLAFFVKNKYEATNALLSTIVITLIILFMENILAYIISRMFYRKDEIVPYSLLKENDVDTFATDKEVENMFDETFNEVFGEK